MRKRINPRIRRHRNGTATLSGVPSGILQGILTIASLYDHEHPFEPKQETGELAELIRRNNAVSREYVRARRFVLDSLSPFNQPTDWSGVSLKDKLRARDEERRFLNYLIREIPPHSK